MAISSFLFSLIVIIGIVFGEEVGDLRLYDPPNGPVLSRIHSFGLPGLSRFNGLKPIGSALRSVVPKTFNLPGLIHPPGRRARSLTRIYNRLSALGLLGLKWLGMPGLQISPLPPVPVTSMVKEKQLIIRPVPTRQSTCLSRVWGPSCPKMSQPVIITMNPRQIARIVEKHNKARRLLSIGAVPGIKPTIKMYSLHWSPELAYLAERNVMQCKMQKEDCVSSGFHSSGQNLALSSYAGPIGIRSDDALIETSLDMWWNEFKNGRVQDAPSEFGRKFLSKDRFEAMVQERNVAVGCAASRFFQQNEHQFLMACYYAYPNMNERSQPLPL